MKLFRKRYYKALKHGCEEDKYTPDLDMLPTITATAGIIGTVLILLVPTSAVFATEENYNSKGGSSTFKVNVYGSGINADTGELLTEVILENGVTDSDTLTPGDTGRVFLGQFEFDRDESDEGDSFQACVTDEDSGLSNCETGYNSEDNKPEEITVRVQDDNGFSDTSYEIESYSFREYGAGLI